MMMMTTEEDNAIKINIQERLITNSFKQYIIRNQSGVQNNDYQLLVHGNGLMVVTLAKSHFLVAQQNQYTVTRVQFDQKLLNRLSSDNNTNNTAAVSKRGKSLKKKKKSQQNVHCGTLICTIYYSPITTTTPLDSESHSSDTMIPPATEASVTFVSYIDAKMQEVNELQLTSYPTLIQKRHFTFGFLCILNANHTFISSPLLHAHLVESVQAECISSLQNVTEQQEGDE